MKTDESILETKNKCLGGCGDADSLSGQFY